MMCYGIVFYNYIIKIIPKVMFALHIMALEKPTTYNKIIIITSNKLFTYLYKLSVKLTQKIKQRVPWVKSVVVLLG